VVRRLVEDEDVRARGHEDRQPQALALPAAQPLERLLGLVAGEQEAAEQRPRLVGRLLRVVLAGLQHRARPAELELLAVLGEVADLHVVAGLQAPAVERPPAGQRVDERRLARPVRPDERHVLAALEPQVRVVDQHAPGDLEVAVLELEDDAAGALGRLEGDAHLPRVPRVAGDALDLLELLDPRLRLARLRRLGPEALDERLHPGDLGLLLLDRPARARARARPARGATGARCP
jgi:hypothetical protein